MNPAPINPLTGLPLPPPVSELPLYYENGKGYRLDAERNGKFIAISEMAACRYLASVGYLKRKLPPAQLSAVETALLEVLRTKTVDYVGPLAGRGAGIYEIDGKRVLVTGGPRILEPDQGVSWLLLRQIFQELFREDPKQLSHLFGWIKLAYAALRRGDTNPFKSMTERTGFNADLLGAECLMFGDEQSSTHMSTRRALGAQLKQLVANGEHRCEGKYANALTLRPFWRVTMSLNDEPENISVLPPLDESIIDKLMLFKVSPVELFNTDQWTRDRAKDMARLRSEIPGFLWHLINEFQIPSELRDHRFGIKAYHHPDVLQALGKLSSESRLLELIDASGLFVVNSPASLGGAVPQKLAPIAGTAAEIERRLLNSSLVGSQVRRLLSWEAAAGTYLSRLAKRVAPTRVTMRLREGHSLYTITPPTELRVTDTNGHE